MNRKNRKDQVGLGPRPTAQVRERHERIEAHVEEFIGPIEFVFHDALVDVVKVVILVIAPSEARPFYTLVSCGMSDVAMSPPQESRECCLAELVLCLPEDWGISRDLVNSEPGYWPVQLMFDLSRYPHENELWMWAFHTLPNGRPFSGSVRMDSVFLLIPQLGTEEEVESFSVLPLKDGGAIHFLTVHPIYPEELEYKLSAGSEELMERFIDHGVTELLDIGRPPVVNAS